MTDLTTLATPEELAEAPVAARTQYDQGSRLDWQAFNHCV